jgi:hypothetical protein
MRRIFAALIASLLGCNAADNVTAWEDGSIAHVWIDDPHEQFTAEQLAIIGQSTAAWQSALGEHVQFVFVSGKGPQSLIVIRPVELATIEAETGNSAQTHWMPTERGGAIDIAHDVDAKTFRMLVMHELGHALGLEHGPPNTVMFERLEHNPGRVTCADVWQFCEANGCDWESLAPCS